jgi:NAD+ synthase
LIIDQYGVFMLKVSGIFLPQFYLCWMMISLRLNYKKVRKHLVAFIRHGVHGAGFEKAVLGLSGGVDSSLCAYLAAEALGNGNVYALNMPYRDSSLDGIRHARQVADHLKIHFLSVEITPMIDSYFKVFPDADPIRRGNKMARERMSILYDHSARFNALVLGSSNKTEVLLGYGTIYGDMACAINPLGDLYKTQVWDLAREVGVPEEIIEKDPSADLWQGQTDEGELGLQYSEVDRLLNLMIDNELAREELVQKGFRDDFIEKVEKRIRSSEYKRRMPIIARIYRHGRRGVRGGQ